MGMVAKPDKNQQARKTWPSFLLTAGVGRPAVSRRAPACGSPFVSVIIVSYNGKRFLDDCLRALEAQTFPRERWEVIVVDNGSTDGSVVYLRERYPWVRVIAAEKNLGFAKGNNEGIRQSRGDFIALLNNDTIVAAQWLEALVEALQEDPHIGAATSKILFKHEPFRINSAGLNLYRDGRGGDRGFRQTDRGQFNEATDVFGGCGASVLFRREMLDDVGLLDERFFMYYEDLDLAWRAHLRGWRIRYTPRSVVYHVHCGTSGEWSPFFLYYVERNGVFVNIKNAALLQVARALAGFCGRAARKCFRVATWQERSQRQRQQALAYLLAWLSLLGGIPAMLWKRFQVRTRRRLVSDRAFAHLITRSPS